MITDLKTLATLPLQQVVHLQLDSVFIAGLHMPDNTRINLNWWKGQVMEIHCHEHHQQWVPVAIQYRDITPEYTAYLNQQLTHNQLRRLTEALEAYASK
jgi:hypothetical protein